MSILTLFTDLVSKQMQSMRLCLKLARMEAQLARMTIFPLILNLCMIVLCVISLWCSMMGIVGYGLLLTLHNLMLAMGCVCLFNVLLFCLAMKWLSININRMSFEKTRQYLTSKSTEAVKNDIKEAGESTDCSIRQNFTSSQYTNQ